MIWLTFLQNGEWDDYYCQTKKPISTEINHVTYNGMFIVKLRMSFY